MEFYKTKLWDGDVNILFTGKNYFFFHGFYGVICIAERDEDVELSNSGDKVWNTKFTLYSGHRDGEIEKECFALAKKIIEKHDQKYIKKNFEFDEVVTDLNRCIVKVSYELNHF